MNKLSTYLISFFISVLLVFACIASVAALIADINITQDKAYELIRNNQINEKVHAEMNDVFSERYYSSRIPANVYMDNISADYIEKCIEDRIDSAFDSLEGTVPLDASVPENSELESDIRKYFEDFADSEGYEKDEKFEKKVENTISDAYKIIGSHCDVFKVSALNEHKVFSKLSGIYKKRNIMAGGALISCFLLIALLIIVNMKKRVTAMYWTGISALISGAAGTIFSVIILNSKYYDSFSIKQPGVFTAYTQSMYKLTEAFLAASIAVAVIGISLLVIYTIVYDKNKHQDVKPTEL